MINLVSYHFFTYTNTTQIIANGLFFNPKAAIGSFWDILDWLVVLTNLAGLVTLVNVCGTAPKQIVTLRNIPIWIEYVAYNRNETHILAEYEDDTMNYTPFTTGCCCSSELYDHFV